MISAISTESFVSEGYSPIFDEGWLKKDDKSLNVRILTQDLELRSVSEKDKEHYEKLYSDPDTMKMFTDNEKRLLEMSLENWKEQQMTAIASRVNTWIQRWKDGVPFSAFAIYHRQTGDFVGHAVAGFGDKPGESEIAYIIAHRHWHKGYGSQAIEAIVQKWMPYLKKEGYETEETVDGQRVSRVIHHVTATSRLDNIYSTRILEKNGFVKTGEKEAWGCNRGVFERDIS